MFLSVFGFQFEIKYKTWEVAGRGRVATSFKEL
jgi:hypothetical protein